MKTQDTALANLIFSGDFVDVDLYTITLAGGGVLRFTTADFDVVQTGARWSAHGVAVDTLKSKTQAHWKVGLDVDTWLVVVMPRPFDLVTGALFPDVIGGVPWIAAAQAGALDFADFQVDRAFFAANPTYPLPPGNAVTPVGTVTIFSGMVAEVDTTSATVAIMANDWRALLTFPMPRNFFQASCRHTFCDIGCTLNLANFTARNYVANGAASTPALVVSTWVQTIQGASFSLGSLTFTSGQNADFTRTITDWTEDGPSNTSTFSLLNPFPFQIEDGDTFNLTSGCDKTLLTCTYTFANQGNFGGMPFIPNPEASA